MALDTRKIQARTADLLGPRICNRAVARFAALAGAEPGPLGVIWGIEERNDITSRPPARTPGPTVDARRTDRVHEAAVGVPVAPHHGAPARLLILELSLSHRSWLLSIHYCA